MSKKIASAAISVSVAFGLIGVAPVAAQDVEIEAKIAEDNEVSEQILSLKAAAAHARKVARQLERGASGDESEDEADDDLDEESDEAEDDLDEESDEAEEAADEDDDDDDESDDDNEDIEKARKALQKVIDRLSEEGAGGNGVAVKVLQAILDGESPAGIGAEHGKEMAAAAKERREERREERDERKAAREERREERKAAREEAGNVKADRTDKSNNGNGRNSKDQVQSS